MQLVRLGRITNDATDEVTADVDESAVRALLRAHDIKVPDAAVVLLDALPIIEGAVLAEGYALDGSRIWFADPAAAVAASAAYLGRLTAAIESSSAVKTSVPDIAPAIMVAASNEVSDDIDDSDVNVPPKSSGSLRHDAVARLRSSPAPLVAAWLVLVPMLIWEALLAPLTKISGPPDVWAVMVAVLAWLVVVGVLIAFDPRVPNLRRR
jgi:hypothetical protein